MGRDLQRLNEENKQAMWAEGVSECRNSGLRVLAWCKENGVCSQTYYKWQKGLFAMAKAQQETQFVEVTPATAKHTNNQVGVTVRVGGVAAENHNGADASTVETVFGIMKLC